MTSRSFPVMLVVLSAALVAGCGEGGLSGSPDSGDEDAVDVTAPDSPYDAYDPGWTVPDAIGRTDRSIPSAPPAIAAV